MSMGWGGGRCRVIGLSLFGLVLVWFGFGLVLAWFGFSRWQVHEVQKKESVRVESKSSLESLGLSECECECEL